jgi:hypothetical protein
MRLVLLLGQHCPRAGQYRGETIMAAVTLVLEPHDFCQSSAKCNPLMAKDKRCLAVEPEC